jgi:hypothetical protein
VTLHSGFFGLILGGRELSGWRLGLFPLNEEGLPGALYYRFVSYRLPRYSSPDIGDDLELGRRTSPSQPGLESRGMSDSRVGRTKSEEVGEDTKTITGALSGPIFIVCHS